MKKIIVCLLALLLLCAAMAEDKPDGSVSAKYTVSCEMQLLAGWDSVRYIESEGLLMSAFNDTSDLTISLEEDESMADRLASVSRYGSVLSSSGTDSRYSYSYRSKRGSTVYYCEVAVTDFNGMKLSVTLNTEDQNETEQFDRLSASVELMEIQASGAYMALLTGCETQSGSICLTLDFVSVDYDNNFGNVIFINDDTRGYEYRVDRDAILYLPDVTSDLYSMKETDLDADAISYIIREYNGINGSDGLYLVQFDADNNIVRLQHYNAV